MSLVFASFFLQCIGRGQHGAGHRNLMLVALSLCCVGAYAVRWTAAATFVKSASFACLAQPYSISPDIVKK